MKRLAVMTVLLVAGCTSQHYLVLEEETPLYRDARGEEVLARLPRYHHEALDEVEEIGGRVRVTYGAERGYAPRRALRVFSYLDPMLDGGAARDEALRRELREAQLAELGRGWPEAIVEAVRDERVVVGMTRRQVELAWGWPLTVEAGHAAEQERWIYRVDTHRLERRFVDNGFAGGVWIGAGYPGACNPRPWGWRGGWAWRGGWVTVRVPVIEERVVTLGADGRVVSVEVERVLKA